jgi:hypothetical protein
MLAVLVLAANVPWSVTVWPFELGYGLAVICLGFLVIDAAEGLATALLAHATMAPMYVNPFTATSLKGYWRNWNPVQQNNLYHGVNRPIYRVTGSKTTAHGASFLMSSVLHVAPLLAIGENQKRTLQMCAFFVVQFCALEIERHLEPTQKRWFLWLVFFSTGKLFFDAYVDLWVIRVKVALFQFN